MIRALQAARPGTPHALTHASRPNYFSDEKKFNTFFVEESFLYIMLKLEPSTSKTAPTRVFFARGVIVNDSRLDEGEGRGGEGA